MTETPDPRRSSLGQWDCALAGAMDREILRSEWHRAVLVMGTGLVLLALLIFLWTTADEASPSLNARARRGVAVVVGMLAYETGVLIWLKRWRKHGRPSPWAFRYLNTMVEVSIPTVAVVLLGTQMGFLEGLAGGAPFVYFILIVLSAFYLDFWLCATAGLVAAAEFSSLVLLSASGYESVPGWEVLTSSAAYWVKAATLLLAGLATGFVARQIRRQLVKSVRTVAERDRAISIFGQHVSPQVAEMLLHQPIEFAGEERNVCVMFLDIRDFSRLAADCSPGEVMEYLNTLFRPMINLVNQHRGIVNKFLGDGFMAVFGAPVDDTQQCQHAIEAAKEILRTVERFDREGRIPPTRIGVGLHMGWAVTGNVGSFERKEYTIIGDVVNVASRIEQATKQFGVSILISEAVKEKLDLRKYLIRDVGLVELKGQAKPTRLYRIE